MSLSLAFGNALSGLTATARQAEVVSANLANAATPGYGRRSVSLSAQSLGGEGRGVQVTGIDRQTNAFLTGDRRLAQAAAGEQDTRTAFLQKLAQIFGTPGETGSLSARVDAFDTALLEAASRPESEARLGAATDRARALALALNQASDALQDERLRADGQIARAVEDLNTGLRQVRVLNSQIRTGTSSGQDVSALIDQRQQIVDRLSDLVPLRELPREHGEIALITTGGAVLLEGREARFGFTPVHTLVPEMTQASGGLSGLVLNDQPMATAGESSLLLGGRLAGLFAVRDELAVAGQAQLDGMARDLLERFDAPGPDTTLAPTDPGLFTDAGAVFDPLDEIGLSARLALNAAVDPDQGGAVWRLRDGLEAALPGPSGEAGLLIALSDALTMAQPLSSLAFAPGARSLPGLAAELLSAAATERLTAESEQAFATSRYSALDEMEKAGGVDTDQELQTLLVIEKSYAANAKVIQTLDAMLGALLEI